MGCCCSASTSPYNFKELFENQDDLSLMSFDSKDFKQSLIRLDPYIETSALSFCGTNRKEPGPVVNWLLGPEMEVIKRSGMSEAAWAADDTGKEYLGKLDTRRKIVDRLMAAALVSTSVLPPHSGFVVAKAEGSSQIDGNVLTVETTNETYAKFRGSGISGHSIPAAHVAVRFYPSGYKSDPLRWIYRLKKVLDSAPKAVGGKTRTVADYSLTSSARVGRAMWGRFLPLDKVSASVKKKFTKNVPFIYVGVVSVAPEAQGQGLCSRLMRGINGVADKLGWACYLETGSARLEKVYERYGYKTVHTEAYGADCDRDTDWPDLEFRIMMRPATSTAVPAGE